MSDNDYIVPKALLIRGKKFKKDIKKGRRTTSVRKGHLDYKIGDIVLIGDPIDGWCVFRKITNVRHTILKEITPEEWGIEGFEVTKDKLKHLRKFFTTLKLDSKMTVVTFSPRDITVS